MENREQLNLNAAQVDSIIAAAFYIKVLIADGEITEGENNCWLFEREFIMQTLTEEQVGEFAVIRYTDDAVKYAIKTWEEGKSYQMEIQDSIMLWNELFNYHVNKLKIQYVYYDEEEQMQEMLNFWYREAYPKFLARVMSERRRRQVEEADDRDFLKF